NSRHAFAWRDAQRGGGQLFPDCRTDKRVGRGPAFAGADAGTALGLGTLAVRLGRTRSVRFPMVGYARLFVAAAGLDERPRRAISGDLATFFIFRFPNAWIHVKLIRRP